MAWLGFPFRLIFVLILALIVLHPDGADAKTETRSLEQLTEAARAAFEAVKSDEATGLGSAALEMAVKRFGENHDRVAALALEFGKSHHANANHAAAEPLFRRALAIREAKAAPSPRPSSKAGDKPQAASLGEIRWWLGETLNWLTRYGEAEPLLARAVQELERDLGADHEMTASALHDLGWSLRFQERYAESIPHYERALRIRTATLGEANFQTATTALQLAWAFNGANRGEEAERMARHALALMQPILPDMHTDLGWANEALATVLADRKNYKDAGPFAERELTIKEHNFGASDIQTAYALHRLGNILMNQSKYAAAEPMLRRALEIKEQVKGPGDVDVAYTLRELGRTYVYTMRLKEGRAYFERALTILEQHFGPEHMQIAWVLDGLLTAHTYASEFDDALRVGQRSMELRRKLRGSDDAEMIVGLNMLALAMYKSGRMADADRLFDEALALVEASPHTTPLVRAQQVGLIGIAKFGKGNLAEAETLIRRSIALFEQGDADSQASYHTALQNLAKILTTDGRYAEAEPIVKRIVELAGRSEMLSARDRIDILNTQSIMFAGQDRYQESEQALKQAIALTERTFGENSIDVAQLLANLAYLFTTVERHADAMPLIDRALVIRRAVYKPDHVELGITFSYRANLYNALDRYTEAEADARASLTILDREYGNTSSMALTTRDMLATALKGLKRHGEAAKLLEETIELTKTAEGENSLRLSTLWHNLGLVYVELEQFEKAESAYQTSMVRWEAGLRSRSSSQDDIGRGQNQKIVGDMYGRQGRWNDALNSYRQASANFVTAFLKPSPGRQEYFGRNWLKSVSYEHLGALWNVAAERPAERPALIAEGFEVAQWVMRSTTSSAVSQVSARHAARDRGLAEKVRERQDAQQLWQLVDGRLGRLIAEPIHKRDEALVARLRAEAAAIETKLSALDKLMTEQFPAFAELANPRPLPLISVQKLLRPDEALVQYLMLNGYTLAWVVTPSDMQWFRVDLTHKDLWEKIQRLRCGLDPGQWHAGDRGTYCGNAIGMVTDRYGMRPFDVELAHALYKELLGPAEALIGGKHLHIVASNVLTSLPFNALVTRPPEATVAAADIDYRQVAWLALRQRITIVPAVSSLRAQRTVQRPSRATEAYLGIGDPLLSEGGQCPTIAVPDSCPQDQTVVAALGEGHRSRRSGLENDVLANVYRGGRAVPAAVRALCRLADTAHELRCVARSLGAGEGQLLLDERATEGKIKQLNASGELARYRILHFATHGLLAGDHEQMTKALAEPALVLTPPPDTADAASLANDDGLLTTSEIAALTLNADWVVLSACNTASGEKGSAEALTGLARAFLYAGAQALLVSQWEVYSEAAVRLTTHAFAQLRINPAIGRSEGLRRSMTALIEKGDFYAHPAYWAPFIVVGDGGE